MPGEPTIESQMLAAADPVHTFPNRDEPALSVAQAVKVSREYATERTEPLVEALESVLEAYAAGLLDSAEINPARAALAAEEEARRG